MFKNYLITGGAGFVGSSLAIQLKKNYENVKIIALDNLRRRGSEFNINRLKSYGIEFLHGDIRNKEDIDSVGEIDCIIEASADPAVLTGYTFPEYVINTNLSGTLNCLEYGRKRGACFIFLSSSRVYPIDIINSLNYIETETRYKLTDDQSVPGTSSKGYTEDFPLTGRRSLYGATKLASEIIIQEYFHMFNLKGVINRCGVLTGPWQMGKIDQGFVVFWIAKHIYGGKLSYIGYGGSGKQVRDILHVDDLYGLIDIQLRKIDEISGEIFNVGGGKGISISLLELTTLSQEITGRKIKIDRIDKERLDDIRIYLSDNSKVTKMTGWSPKIRIEDILIEINDWIRQNMDLLKPIIG
jgi:CDP-paratose 2-epimerase